MAKIINLDGSEHAQESLDKALVKALMDLRSKRIKEEVLKRLDRCGMTFSELWKDKELRYIHLFGVSLPSHEIKPPHTGASVYFYSDLPPHVDYIKRYVGDNLLRYRRVNFFEEVEDLLVLTKNYLPATEDERKVLDLMYPNAPYHPGELYRKLYTEKDRRRFAREKMAQIETDKLESILQSLSKKGFVKMEADTRSGGFTYVRRQLVDIDPR